MIDNEIIQEATEAVEKGLDAGYAVEPLLRIVKSQKAEIERLQCSAKRHGKRVGSLIYHLEQAKSEAYREFAEKITEVFLRYAHLHSHADCAKKDYIEAGDGTQIEMQSVWDVFSLKKYGIAEYEEMNRLQKNIEIIDKERLLTELEKDFRLLAKELTEKNNFKE